MDLSIIIVNWNTKDLLQQCIQSIIENPPLAPFEIWVVDNASSDGSTDMVRSFFPEVNLIENEVNIGFGNANNLAIERCHGNYILLLNPDTKVIPEAIEILYNYLDSHPEAGVTGARLLYPNGSLQTSCYPFPTLLREFWRLVHLDRLWPIGVYNQSKWDQTVTHKVEIIQGAAFMVRKAVLDQVGYFDPEFFMYTEEVDLCFRIHKAGWDLFWVPQSEIVHFEGQSTKQMRTEMFLQLYKSKLLFMRKHHGWFAGVLYKLILGLIALPRVLIRPKAGISNNYRKLLSALPEM